MWFVGGRRFVGGGCRLRCVGEKPGNVGTKPACGGGGVGGHCVGLGGVLTAVSPPQAVIQNPFSNGGSPGAEGGTEGRFAWGGDGTMAVQADPALAQAGGQGG